MAIEKEDPRAAYVQIADDLRASIARGELTAGDRLPTTNELMERYQVASMTVRSAFRILRDEGLVVSRQGTGVFVRSTVAPGTAPAADLANVVERLESIAGNVNELAERLTAVEIAIRQRPPRTQR